ncbi:MAG: methylmalonyl-CoA mutase family protein [Terricaulis sp.]
MISTDPLSLGEPAEEAAWRALVEKALKGAPWSRLTTRTADGIEIGPLYREEDCATATDISGFPGAAPFVRGATSNGGWLIRQSYEHPDPARANRDILADLAGGVGAIELVIDPNGASGIAIQNANDLDRALASVILEAAPVSLDADVRAAELLRDKLKGVAAQGTAFNLDPIGALMRRGPSHPAAIAQAIDFAAAAQPALPAATFLRADARAVHEAGGTQAQEVAAALCSGISYLRALEAKGLTIEAAAASLCFALAVGPDVLVEASKLRTLRLCWARVLQASGAAAQHRAARIHAFTSRRVMTRTDAWTNIVRVTSAAVAAAIGGADAITTRPFTEALGLPTPFARRIARNTQHVLLEECRLGHVADPAGGAWFVEKLTRDLADEAWRLMQEIEAQGGIVTALHSGMLQGKIADARAARQKDFATRRETITGVTDYPLLDAALPEFEARPATEGDVLPAIRWAEPFEDLRDRAETGRRLPAGNNEGRLEAGGPRPSVFFANLGALADFSARSNFARNLFAIGGVGAIAPEAAYPSAEALLSAFKQSGAQVAVLCGTDARYGEDMPAIAEALHDAGCRHLILAGEPRGTHLIQQFIFARCDVLAALASVHAALGIAP